MMRRDYDQVDVSLLCGGDNSFARHTAAKHEAAICVALFCPLNPVDWYRVPTGPLIPDNLVIFASSPLSIYKLKVS
jgi:hypothetical protein